MNLPFTRHIGGKETYFPEKIIGGLVQDKIIQISKASELIRDAGYPEEHPLYYIDTCKDYFKTIAPKLHTFRPNLKGTWKAGVMIDFVFWSGRPYWSTPVKFAPRLPVVSLQKIEIRHYKGFSIKNAADIFINGRVILSENEKLALAKNDGFDSIEDFFKWFDKPFTGSIIHWTDLRY